MTEMDLANAEQSARWNDQAGRSWAELSDLLDRLLEPFVEPLLDSAGPLTGQRVLDVGCGAGALTFAAAEQGASGLGIDISGPLVEAARERAARLGASKARFVRADAQTHSFEPGCFDVLVSRFGVMFFDDPAAAFGNLRSAMQPCGRLVFVAWRSPAENGFMTAAERSLADILPQLPARTPNAPGQFGFADPDRMRSILTKAGWRDVEVEPLDVECGLPEEDLRVYVRRMGPVADLLPSLDDGARSEVEARLDEAFLPFLREGEAPFTAACWQVTARA